MMTLFDNKNVNETPKDNLIRENGKIYGFVVKFMIVLFKIRLMNEFAQKTIKISKMINIADTYNQAMCRADEIWGDKPEIKEVYLKALHADLTQQFKNL